MIESKLFTKTELEELNLRLKEKKKKNYKIWWKTKPKVIELLEWCKIKGKLGKLLENPKNDT